MSMKHRWCRAAQRGHSYGDGLLIAAILSVILGAVSLVALPPRKRSMVKWTREGAIHIQKVLEKWQASTDPKAILGCPTVEDLVKTQRLSPKRTQDLWGTPYRIVCRGALVHVVSSGRDRKPDTPDDIREDMTDLELDALVSP
ncbi:Hypothetical protein A7982_07044 [Minicystis rosea]|nr:Hypothetical protein A7982_07044 [Minicystis rosea]